MRIISFGCSYTYGHGLEDCLLDDMITHGPLPSLLAYPNLVANYFQAQLINLAKPGNSNKEIWHDILKFNFNKKDIVLIGWTYYSRFCIIHSESIERINPWNDSQRLFFMKYSNRHDMILDFYGRLNHVNLYLQELGVHVFNYVIEKDNLTNPKWNRTKILGHFEKLDLAKDNCHPGIVSHRSFLKKICDDISSNLLLSYKQTK